MKINKPLNQLFANEARIQILRTLFKFPGEFTGRHIARLSHLPHSTARLNLVSLEASDMLNVKYAGRSKLYSLNTDNILYKPLADLFSAEKSVLGKLEGRLINTLLGDVKTKDALAHASLYGSVARGDERPGSDIDVLLVFEHTVDESHLNQVLEPLEDDISKSFGKHLHIMTVECKTSDSKWRDLLRPTFVEDVSRHGKLLYGDPIEEVIISCQKKQKRSQHNRAKKKAL